MIFKTVHQHFIYICVPVDKKIILPQFGSVHTYTHSLYSCGGEMALDLSLNVSGSLILTPNVILAPIYIGFKV